jgi:Family of unknown function (DUF6496)
MPPDSWARQSFVHAAHRDPAPTNNCVPAAARLLTLTDHPGLDLVVVIIRMGGGTDYCHSRSGLVMEMPPFHDMLRKTQVQRGAEDDVPRARREPLPLIGRFLAGATSCFNSLYYRETSMAKKRKRKYSRGAGTEVKREMHRYKRGKAKSGKGGKGGK